MIDPFALIPQRQARSEQRPRPRLPAPIFCNDASPYQVHDRELLVVEDKGRPHL